MGAHRSRRTLSRRLLPAVGGLIVLGLTTACGGAAASPTPTVAATAAAVPASPQRPTLLSPVPSPSPTTSSSAVAKPTQAEGSQTYTVQTGDTLAKIADHFYGDSTQWRRIYDANKDTIGENPDALKLDMKLTIPPGSPTPSPTP